MRSLRIVTSFGWLGPASAILVATGSPCGTLCGNVLDATTSADIVCKENSYTSGAGIVYQQCVACELDSDYQTSNDETDMEAVLYNLRYAFSYCLFGVPDNQNIIDSPCITTTACGPFRAAILSQNLSAKAEGYDYCDAWPLADHKDTQGCKDCLRAGDQHYLANFFTVLQAGCEQKPASGTTVSIKGNVFSNDKVNITEPTPTATVNPDWFDHGPLTMEAKVGIAAGGVVLILGVIGFFIIWNGKRRRKAFLRTLETKQIHHHPTSSHKGWPTPLITRDMHDTPLSQKPLRSWDDSPLSARSEKTFPRYFSPYSSQYNSPVSATEGHLPHWPVMAHEAMHQQQAQNPDVGMALGGDDPSFDRVSTKGKEREEAYEMHPVDGSHGGAGLYHSNSNQSFASRAAQQHPGYFFNGDTHAGHYAYHTEEEWRRAHRQ